MCVRHQPRKTQLQVVHGVGDLGADHLHPGYSVQWLSGSDGQHRAPMGQQALQVPVLQILPLVPMQWPCANAVLMRMLLNNDVCTCEGLACINSSSVAEHERRQS